MIQTMLKSMQLGYEKEALKALTNQMLNKAFRQT